VGRREEPWRGQVQAPRVTPRATRQRLRGGRERLGYAGLTVRLYDAERDEWSIYWASTRQGLGLPPQVGRFGDDGRGVFLSDDVYEGRPVRVAYIWSDITADSARWEQAFSPDAGVTWETNWIAEFRRS
jgi:hypothetical protein